MTQFQHRSPIAHELYEAVRHLPIIDYHNHLDLHADSFSTLTGLWITPDPYKHRLMRIMGVPESHITGGASDYDKFRAFCRIFPMLMGTPVYDWCRMELWQVFGIDTVPSDDTADAIWQAAMERLPSVTPASVFRQFNVVYASPVASMLSDVSFYGGMPDAAPSLRGDDAAAPDTAFAARLSEVSGITVASLDEYFAAMDARLDAFAAVGCRFADHALDDGFCYLPDDGKNDARFAAMLRGGNFDRNALTSHILRTLGGMYAKRGMILQLHIGAMRHTSTRLRAIAGAAGGYAAIGDVSVRGIVSLLDDMEKVSLPRTILFPLNPAIMEQIAVLTGSFSADGVPAIVSEGPAWWWCDHRGGIQKALESLTFYAALSAFPGMTTDSRSLLSFVRHDYFRRILCGWMADKVDRGEFPRRMDDLTMIVKKLCYENARDMIGGTK